MKYIAGFLVGLNLVLILINYGLLISGKVALSTYNYGGQFVVVFSIFVSAYLFLHPSKIRWFGDKLPHDHPASVTISYIFSVICIGPAMIFNSNPLLTIFT